MWVRASCQLSDHVFQVVTPATSHFLLFDDEAALVDAGLAALQQQLLGELDSCLGSRDSLKHVLLTHAHFDHVGGLPFLRQAFPGIEVVASPQIAEALADNDTVVKLFDQNKRYAGFFQSEFEVTEADWKKSLRIDRIMGDGDSFSLGDDAEVKLVAVPGHSEDSVGYYVKVDAAFAAGEAAGSYHGRDKVAASFAWGYEPFMKSLQKIIGLDIRVLGFSHCGALTGDLARKHFMNVQSNAEKFLVTVKEQLAQGQLIDEIHAGILAEWVAEGLSPEGPYVDEQREVLRSMVKAAAETK